MIVWLESFHWKRCKHLPDGQQTMRGGNPRTGNGNSYYNNTEIVCGKKAFLRLEKIPIYSNHSYMQKNLL